MSAMTVPKNSLPDQLDKTLPSADPLTIPPSLEQPTETGPLDDKVESIYDTPTLPPSPMLVGAISTLAGVEPKKNVVGMSDKKESVTTLLDTTDAPTREADEIETNLIKEITAHDGVK
jgi:hypothetical protein